MCIDDLGDGLEGELFTWDAHDFGKGESYGCEHSCTSVFELSLAVPGKPFWGALLFESNISAVQCSTVNWCELNFEFDFNANFLICILCQEERFLPSTSLILIF